MKIVFSTDQIYLHGGIEKVLAEKANYFADVCGYEVIVLTNQQKEKSPCYPLSKKIQTVDLGINYNREKSYFSWVNLKKVLNHIYQLNRFFYTLQPDVVIVSNFGFDTYFVPFLYKKAKKIKEFHSSRYFESQLRNRTTSFFKKKYYQLNDWVESKYDYLVVLNQDEVSCYKSDNAVVIPNPVTIPKVTANLMNKKVVAAGRIAPVKGFEKLIEAWKVVHAIAPEWELHFYGEDYLDTQKQLEEIIKENHLEKVIFFKGSSSNMTETFMDYSIYTMSSQTECFPMVLLEALSVGLPIVSFDCPNGPRNIITNGEDGLLAENQNIKDLAEKILVLIQKENRRTAFGLAAKVNSERFSTSVVMQRWINLLNS
ncbi:Glycosyltransferase involved in cell wall bisynthesis [Flavobacterium glycines]|uniref:Glycosyl transferase n=1 Tax=Flavobacterium glycines TaxID=551990 RepID=A0A1B9DHB2_9FLAO|nr:glycosyltransferase family 4 protein [Flavobacterium glycines]OCB69081.1 hypothetical protein FBGL_13695 [Flavobacterium glycines]GEL11992.1 glycosyl transferase [Flavobacterium glycines]SDJ54070.1 Glycosyltransferase involved in cell wall bisynthesis [Flavobacterium glycines]